jgi:hypothetical protein
MSYFISKPFDTSSQVLTSTPSIEMSWVARSRLPMVQASINSFCKTRETIFGNQCQSEKRNFVVLSADRERCVEAATIVWEDKAGPLFSFLSFIQMALFTSKPMERL